MIPIKNKPNGFTFTEILIALALVGMLMTPILILQTNVFQTVGYWSYSLQRLFFAEQFLIEQKIAEQKKMLKGPQAQQDNKNGDITKTKTIEFPATKLMYQVLQAPSDSALKKFKDIKLERVIINWQENNKKQEDSIVLCLFKPKQEQKGGA